MRDGQLLFAEATANVKQKLLRERLRDVMISNEPLSLLTEYVMEMREKLRADLLATDDGDVRVELIEQFNKDLHGFHVIYLKGLAKMQKFEDYSEIKALPFLSLYARYEEVFKLIDENINDFWLNKMPIGDIELDVQDFLLSGWDVFVYQLPNALHTMFDMVEITDDTVIEETDWDGVKEKRGKEIIRRNGECGGKVFAFTYIDEEAQENEEGENVRVVYFYSVSIDGKEMRYFKHERRW